MNNLGERIKFLRNNRGWSLDELSKRCNIPKTTIWGIERGSQTSLENLNKITAAFNIDIYELIDSDNNFLGTSESGLHTTERLKFTNENVFKLIKDISVSDNVDFSLMEDDLDYITSSLKNHLKDLVEFVTCKNNNLLCNQTPIIEDLNEEENK